MMAELIDLKVDLIVTFGGPASEAAKKATSTIPIVMSMTGDVAAIGLIASLARPGANVTGISEEGTKLSAKRLEILRETVPQVSRVAVLWNTGDHAMMLRYGEVERAARILRVALQPLGVREPEDLDAAFSAMARNRPDALFVLTDSLTTVHRKRILELSATGRIPAMYEFAFLVQDGGLMSYGPNFDDMFRRAALYVDRILKGAKPSDLPVEQPTRYYLVINLKTAKALGVTIPPSVLLRADRIIE